MDSFTNDKMLWCRNIPLRNAYTHTDSTDSTRTFYVQSSRITPEAIDIHGNLIIIKLSYCN